MEDFKLIYIFCITGAINSLIFTLYIFLSKYKKSISNKLLAFLMLAITIKVSYVFAKYLLMDYPIDGRRALAKLAVVSYMAIGPLFFLYIKSIVDKKFRFNVWMLLLFIPSLVYVFLPRSGIHFLWRDIGSWIFQVWFFGFILLAGILYFKVLNKLKKHELEIERALLNWMKSLLFSIIIIWSTIFFKQNDYLVEILALFSFILYIIIFSALGNFKIISNKIDKFKYISGSYNPSEILERIQALMEAEKPYLESDFSLPKFAEKLHLPVHTVSAILNNYRNQNFAEFTNHYRIEEVKKRLLSDQYTHLSIEGIAYECGFNSLSTFNSTFKKYTHLTPSLYKRQNEGNLIYS